MEIVLKRGFNGCIYKFSNIVNGEIYIGQTSNPRLRYIQHKNPSSKQVVDRAIQKYGIANFLYEELVYISKDTYNEYKTVIDELETFYMNKYRNLGYPLYNQTNTGGGNTWATYNANREYNSISEKQRNLISESLKKYYKLHSCRDMRGDNNPSSKSVIGIDITTSKVVKSYSYCKLASKELGVNYSTMKYKLRKGGLLIDNILYTYEINT